MEAPERVNMNPFWWLFCHVEELLSKHPLFYQMGETEVNCMYVCVLQYVHSEMKMECLTMPFLKCVMSVLRL